MPSEILEKASRMVEATELTRQLLPVIPGASDFIGDICEVSEAYIKLHEQLESAIAEIAATADKFKVRCEEKDADNYFGGKFNAYMECLEVIRKHCSMKGEANEPA